MPLHLKGVIEVSAQQRKIAELGADGWEAVGPVTFSYPEPQRGQSVTYTTQLMLKRPLPD